MAILDTKRLVLRPVERGDVDRLADLFADLDFMRFSLGIFTERAQTVSFVDKVVGWEHAGMPSQFAVVMRETNVLIGYCGFFHHPFDAIEGVEIGYRLDSRYWNKGIGTEAAQAVRDHGFGTLKLPRLISLIHPENVASRRVAEKNGMTVEKEITFRGFPTLVFSMTRRQWLARRVA